MHLPINPMVRGLVPAVRLTLIFNDKSNKPSLILSIEIARRGHIQRKSQSNAL